MNTRTTNPYRLTNRKGQAAVAFGANADEAIMLAADAGTIRGAIVKVELLRAVPTSSTTATYEIVRTLSNRDV